MPSTAGSSVNPEDGREAENQAGPEPGSWTDPDFQSYQASKPLFRPSRVQDDTGIFSSTGSPSSGVDSR